MNSNELFQYLTEQLPNVEYLFFKWIGGNDDWHGYEFVLGKTEAGEVTEFPSTAADEIIDKLNGSNLFEELSLTVNCTDMGWSEGVLLVALKPLTAEFYDDSVVGFVYSEGFKGFAIGGKNHEEIGGSLDF